MRIAESLLMTAVFLTGILLASYLGDRPPLVASVALKARVAGETLLTPGIYAPVEEN